MTFQKKLWWNMRDILLVGNPNVGKTTLFNSLTASSEHTGNFHGVTVAEKAKIVKFCEEDYRVVDLPGIYSLNCFSFEEEVSKREILKRDGQVFVIVDANSLAKNLYLCLQLNELEIDYKVLINNYDYFTKHGGKLDINRLSKNLNKDVQVINAKKTKLKDIIKENKSTKEYEKTFKFDRIEDKHKAIKNILINCYKAPDNYIYGYSKLDKVLLNPFVSIVGFLLLFFLGVYLIFFVVGPFVSLKLSIIIDLIFKPILNLLYCVTDNIWLLEFVSNGVVSSFSAVLCFLPQVVLLFVFLTVLEDSGLISRIAFSFDDFLTKFGLNGKAIYVMLLGIGCNTMSCLACRSMSDKNMRSKTCLINPYISCMARLPIFVLIASCFFKKYSYFVIIGLYLIGFIVALIASLLLNKTILPSEKSQFLLEFPPIRGVDFKHVVIVAYKNAVDFIKRVFGVVFAVGVIVWILTHTEFNFRFTQDITSSILFVIASKLSFVLRPLGLDNAGILSALIVGVMAKELIVSTFSIINKQINLTLLSNSLARTSSAICLTMPSAISFMLFVLLYSPCVANLAVIKKEIGTFFMWFALISQICVAYAVSSAIYLVLTKGIFVGLISIIICVIVLNLVVFAIKKVRPQCLTCNNKTN